MLGQHPRVARVYAASSTKELETLYDDWASTYDADMVSEDYVAPAICAKTLSAQLPTSIAEATILDAGCGSGGVGKELQQLGAKTIDGVDYSNGMLKFAEKTGAYRKLTQADLTKPIDIPDATYDAVICVGTLTQGHVGPVPALGEFARVVKKQGIVVATILDKIWSAEGFDKEVDRLVKEGGVELLSKETQGYRKRDGVGAIVLVLKRV